MESGHGVPVFLTKLFNIVQENQEPEILKFDMNGRILVLVDQERLQQYLLPEYFGHKNLPSFLRQLNMYGFRKRHNQDVLEFKHKYFRKDGKYDSQILRQLLKKIKRRNEIESISSHSDQEEINVQIDQLRHTQQSLQTQIQNIATQNMIIMNTIIHQQQQMTEASTINYMKFVQLSEQIQQVVQLFQIDGAIDIENSLRHQKQEGQKGLEYILEDTEK